MCYFTPATPKSVGWEKNAKNKLTPRKVDLSSSMDPVKYVCIISIRIQIYDEVDMLLNTKNMTSKTRQKYA